MLSALLALALAAGATALPCAPGFSLEEALTRALALPDARLELLEVRSSQLPGGCLASGAELDRRITASGQVAVKLSGRTAEGLACQGWAWARVKVVASVRVAARALREGDRLADATVLEDREITSKHEPLSDFSELSIAARNIPAGTLLQPYHVRPAGLAPGEPIAVLVRSGAVSIVQTGRVTSCVRGRACAQLPSGKRVQGQFVEGRLVVEVP